MNVPAEARAASVTFSGTPYGGYRRRPRPGAKCSGSLSGNPDEFLEADRSARDSAERGHLAQGAPGTIARDESSIFENPANDADSPQADDSLHSGAPANCRERQTLFTRLTGLRVPGFTAGTSLNTGSEVLPAASVDQV